MTDSPRAWPPHLEGACYTREDGWTRLVPGPDGKVQAEAVPLRELHEAGLDEHPEMQDWQRMLVLRTHPLQNLIPRRTRD